MKKVVLIFIILTLCLTIFAEFVKKPLVNKIAPILYSKSDNNMKVWIFFTDKGIYSKNEMNNFFLTHDNIITERAEKRRLMRSKNLYTFYDIPLRKEYIEILEENGIKIVHQSKWLNAVSAYINSEQLNILENLSFVYYVKPVAKSYKKYDLQNKKQIINKADSSETDTVINKYNYGQAGKYQIEQIGVNLVHNMGYTGEGVLIAIFDTGFRVKETVQYSTYDLLLKKFYEMIGRDFDENRAISYKATHIALEKVNIVKTYSFVNDTEYVGSPSSLEMEQVDHGTKMLALIAAYRAGELISPAFGADFILAETEDVSQEIPSEEDNWIRAAEWADSLGADIISSSVGYKEFDEGYEEYDYSYSMMTGDSCAITIAADIAAQNGIVVVNAIGNFIDDGISLRDTCIIAPADADSIITVGGVDEYDMLCDISVIGPTYDKYLNPNDSTRIKPEILAMAEYPWTINTSNDTSFVFVSGTSASTALVAGGCALILQAHPDWTAQQVKEALMYTANTPIKDELEGTLWDNLPNDSVGYGIANFYNAIMYGDTEELWSIESDKLLSPYPNPFSISSNSKINFPYQLISKVRLLDLYIYTIDGKLVYQSEMQDKLPGIYDNEEMFSWNGQTLNGKPAVPGIYIVILNTHFGKSVKKIAIIP